jgi:tetratricopeptide (TPR) repeat protein
MSMRATGFATLALVALSAWAGPLAGQSAAADSAWARGDRVAAERLYRARLAADSSDATALFRLALLRGWAGQRRQSLELLDRLLERRPDDIDARLARARMLSALGRHREAEAAADSILRMAPGDIGGLQLRARLIALAGDLIESERLWRQVLERDPGNAETRAGLSQVLRRQGRLAAAAAVLAPVRDRAVWDGDVRDELDRVLQFTALRAGSRVVIEDDSDGNGIASVTLHTAVPVKSGTELRGDVYLRDARLGGVRAAAQGGAVTLRLQSGGGWTVSAGAGVSTTDRADLGAAATGSVTVASPGRHRWTVAVAASRQAHDYTAPMAVNGILGRELGVAINGRPSRGWTVESAAAFGDFESRRSLTRNRRFAGRLALGHPLSNAFSTALQASGFGFRRDVDDGYFDPDFYGVAAIEVQYRRETPRSIATLALAPGLQQVGTGNAPGGAFHAEAGLELLSRPGRSVGIEAVWANTGAQLLSARPAGSYRYASIRLEIRWRFR